MSQDKISAPGAANTNISSIPIRRRTDEIASYSPYVLDDEDQPVYTVVAIVQDFHFKEFPLFPWAGSGFTTDGVQITALIRASSPNAATDILEKVINVTHIQKIYEGVVAGEDLKWMGFIPQPRAKLRMRSWLASLFS